MPVESVLEGAREHSLSGRPFEQDWSAAKTATGEEGNPMSGGRNLNDDDDTLEPSSSLWNFSSNLGPASAEVKVEIAAASHRGHVRENNEDHYLAVRFQRSLETLCTNLEEGILEPSFNEIGYGMLVADGMGGMAAGEVASRVALCKLVELVVNTPDWIMKLTQRDDVSVVMQRMVQRFRHIDDALREQAESDSSLVGMGTTLTVAVSLGRDLLIGHIGDSRAYLMRNEQLHQVTSDHTLAQALIDAGMADPDDTATRAMRHVLTSALGSTAEPADPQVQRLHLSPNDQVLLCTDGLSEMVSNEIITTVLKEASSSKLACQALIDLALAAGGIDNATVVLARYQFS
jgi:PPM family protein phosphatase